MDKEKDKSMKIAIIVAYFGKLPNYFQTFLDSCARNPRFDWLLFVDDDIQYDYPPNVYYIKTSFEECRKKSVLRLQPGE